MDTLLNCIQNEVTAMADLIELLQQEQAALVQAPTAELIEQIRTHTEQKNQRVEHISQLGQVRRDELRRLGFDSQETTSPQWLQTEEQTQRWKELISRTAQAKELNRVNGILIFRHLARTHTMLEVLCGNRQPNSVPQLYGADGQCNSPRGNTQGITA